MSCLKYRRLTHAPELLLQLSHMLTLCHTKIVIGIVRLVHAVSWCSSADCQYGGWTQSTLCLSNFLYCCHDQAVCLIVVLPVKAWRTVSSKGVLVLFLSLLVEACTDQCFCEIMRWLVCLYSERDAKR